MSKRNGNYALATEAGSGSERGMATAEYAVGTVGVCMIAAMLYKLGTDGTLLDLIEMIYMKLNSWITVLLIDPNEFYKL